MGICVGGVYSYNRFKTKKFRRLASGCLQVVAAPVMEPPVHIQGPELLTASVLAAAPPMDQKQLLGLSSLSSACFVFFFLLCRLKQLVYICLHSIVSAVTHRGATVPTDSRSASKPGW